MFCAVILSSLVMISALVDIDSTNHYENMNIKNIIKIAAENLLEAQNINLFSP